MERVILVDEKDIESGSEEKLKAHEEGKLHRAFSVFIFNSRGGLLLQKRASSKYHCGGLWSNTCCSHPRPGENTADAAKRRLMEEMGMECPLEEKFSFIYRVKLDRGLTEHELDHVFFGKCDSSPKLNPKEAEDFKWVNLEHLRNEIRENPGQYTKWLAIALGKIQ